MREARDAPRGPTRGRSIYAVLLRGVNLGSHNKLPMPRFREVLESLGGSSVSTYIQSGNAVLAAPVDDSAVLAQSICSALHSSVGLDVPVIVRSRDEMAGVVVRNPFQIRGLEHKWMHVTFVSSPMVEPIEVDPEAGGDDSFVISGGEVYLHCPGGYGRTKLNNTFWERRLGSPCTTRNWNTVVTLAAMAGDLS